MKGTELVLKCNNVPYPINPQVCTVVAFVQAQPQGTQGAGKMLNPIEVR